MQLIKPYWVHHEGHSIYSVDFQPSENRFVTGGQGGNGSGLVILWNLKPLIDASAEKDDAVPKLLCRLDSHVACVNCVRWCGTGRYLASAGDDKTIMIWHFAGRTADVKSFGGSGSLFPNAELWKCSSVLNGHSGDVLHLAWSTGDKYLASCSVDNTVIVWNALRFPEKIAVLEGHQGLVKGVCWDPLGKYLASQADDKTMRIWATSNWTLIKTIRKPFEECGSTTHVLRLDWSPDGLDLVSAHAMNNGGPTAKIIERLHWDYDRDFVGPRKAVTCVRWNPVIFERKKSNGKKKDLTCCCAIGSKDRSLSVWMPICRRPIVVLYKLFKNTVMDIACEDGNILLACSSDGTIAACSFSSLELGRPLSSQEKLDLLRRYYGKVSVNVGVSADTRGYCFTNTEVIENPDMLALRRQEKVKYEQKKVAAHSAAAAKLATSVGVENAVVAARSTGAESIAKQIEVRTKEGKRKITPIFLGSSVITESSSCWFESSSTQSMANSSVERDATTATSSAQGGTTPTTAIQQHSPNKFVSELVKPSTPPVSTSRTDAKLESEENLTMSRVSRPTALGRPPKRLRLDRRISSSEDEDTSKINGDAAEIVSPAAKSSTSPTHEEVILPALQKLKTVYTNVEQIGRNRGSFCIAVENGLTVGENMKLAKLSCCQRNSCLWQTVTHDDVVSVKASRFLICLTYTDRSVTFHSSMTGALLTPALLLESPASSVVVKDTHVMIIDASGGLRVWSFTDEIKLLCKTSVVPLLKGRETGINSSTLTDFGLPLITTNLGATFLFQPAVRSWQLICDAKDPLSFASNVCTLGGAENGAKTEGPLALIRKNIRPASFATAKLSSGTEALASSSFIETQLCSAAALRSADEYCFWLLNLIQHLVDRDCVVKLRSICQSLVEPDPKPYQVPSSTTLEISRRSLLKDALKIIALNPKLQRLYAEFHDLSNRASEDVFSVIATSLS